MTNRKAANAKEGAGATRTGSTPAKNDAFEASLETKRSTTSKQAQLIAMLVSDAGATLAAMVEATGWQPHTVRAAMTGLRKRNHAISSDKLEGVRT